MSRLTVIVVPDETTDQVRRYRIGRQWIPRALIGAAVLVVAFVGLSVDYVRLRRDAVEVEALRAESAGHRAELESLGAQVGALEAEFGRLHEFERKVRVIANLPGSMLEAQVPKSLRDGQGGGDEEPPAVEAEPEGEARAPSGPAGGGDAEEVDADASRLLLDEAALARVRSKAERVGAVVSVQAESFEALVRDLEGKQHRLASTPSIWPTEGWVTSHYGYRISPFTGRRQFHGGLDIAADFGTPILAPAQGRVVFTGRKGPLGNAVVLDHGFGLRTIFGHLSESFVKRGQVVERGARIAAVGSSGRSTGPHLHYAVAVDGKSVDPADYIFE